MGSVNNNQNRNTLLDGYRASARQVTFTTSVQVAPGTQFIGRKDALTMKASCRIERIITEVKHKHPNNYRIISPIAQHKVAHCTPVPRLK